MIVHATECVLVSIAQVSAPEVEERVVQWTTWCWGGWFKLFFEVLGEAHLLVPDRWLRDKQHS